MNKENLDIPDFLRNQENLADELREGMIENKIKTYLSQCAPHVKERTACKLLAESMREIINLRSELKHESAQLQHARLHAF